MNIENYKRCLNCGKILLNYHGNPIFKNHKQNKIFCNNQCQNDYYYKDFILRWKNKEVSGNTNSKWGGISDYVRKYLFEKYQNKCSICGWSEVNPYTNNIPLEVDHIDGNHENTVEENLRLICPNCHSLTKTFRGGNKGKGRGKTWIPREGSPSKPKEENINFKIVKQCEYCGKDIIITLPSLINIRFCNNECSNNFRKANIKHIPISKEGLYGLIVSTNFVKIGKMFNVSDNTIRKWCRKYNLPFKKEDIKNYVYKE